MLHRFQSDVLYGAGGGPASVAMGDLDCEPNPCAQPCPEDLSGNGSVDFADILAVISAWGPCGKPCPEDLSGNDQVDFADILAIISAWGPC